MSHFADIKNIITYGASQILNLLAPFLVGIFVIPIVGLENWGVIGVTTACYVLLGIFIEFGSNLIGVKEVSAFLHNKNYVENYINTVYTFRLYITIAITCVLLILFIFLNLDGSYYFGLFWMIAWYYNPLWVYQGRQDFKSLNTIVILSKILYLILIFLFIETRNNYVYVVGLLGFSNATIYALYYYKLNVKYVIFKRAFLIYHKNKAIVMSNFAINAYTQAPVFIIDGVLGSTASGIYKVIDLFITAFRSYLGVFFNVTFPNFCSVVASNLKEGKVYSIKMTGLNLLFLLVVTVVIFILIPFSIEYFNMSKNIAEAFNLCRYLLFLPVIIAVNIPFYQMLLYQNENKKLVHISLFALFLTLLVGFILANYFGLTGTIISLYIVELFIMINFVVYSKKYFK